MFTGIVEGLAAVEAIVPRGEAYRLMLNLGAVAEDVQIGDSVAVNGACLTAVVVRRPRVEFDVIRETVERTAFATLRVGEQVNVERSICRRSASSVMLSPSLWATLASTEYWVSLNPRVRKASS